MKYKCILCVYLKFYFNLIIIFLSEGILLVVNNEGYGKLKYFKWIGGIILVIIKCFGFYKKIYVLGYIS